MLLLLYLAQELVSLDVGGLARDAIMLCKLGCLAVIHVECMLTLCDELRHAVGGDETTSSRARYGICGHLLEDVHYVLLLCVYHAADFVEKDLDVGWNGGSSRLSSWYWCYICYREVRLWRM